MDWEDKSENPHNINRASMEDAWLTPKRFALVLACLIMAMFPEVLFGGKSFVFRDFGIFTLPNAYFQRECFWHGEFPLWNPLNCCGIPFLAQWNTACLYPPDLIYLLLPFVWGLNCFLIAHLFVAGFGMYLLASHWTNNRVAAAVAGVAFAFNGMTLNCLMWISNMAALAWMPWVILAVELAWSKGQRQVIVASFVGAIQMLSGAPEIIALTWIILIASGLGRMFGDKQDRGNVVIHSVSIAILITVLCAAQLLPFFDLLHHSERTSSFGTSTWTIPTWGWVNLLLPLYHCYKAPQGVYFQPGQDWTSSYYLGIGTIVLAISAIGLIKKYKVWMLASFALFGFIVALGDQGVLYKILIKTMPMLGFMRYPIKFAFLTVFAVPLLAAFAVAHCRKPGFNLNRVNLFLIFGLVFAAVGTIIIAVVYERNHPFPYEVWPTLFLNGLVRILFLLLIVGTILAYVKLGDPRIQNCFALLLLVFVWLDVETHAPSQNPTVDASVFQPGLLTQRLDPAPKLGESRIFLTRAVHNLVYGSELPDIAKDYISRRCVLLGDCNILDGIPTPDGFYSLYDRDQRTLFSWFFHAPTNNFPAGLADFLGISFFTDQEKVLDWDKRETYLPFYSIGQHPVQAALSNTPALLFQTNFNPRETVYLNAEEVSPATNLTTVGKSDIRVKYFGNQRLEFEADSETPALFVLSQTYNHSWQAHVNGKPAQVLRANYAFQCLVVPGGNNVIELTYQDRNFSIGFSISILAFCTLLVCLKLAPKT